MSGRARQDDGGLGTTTDEVTESAASMWETFVEALPRMGVALSLVALGWLASRAVRWGLHRFWRRRQTPSFAAVMSKLVGWILLVVVVLLAIAVTFPSVRPVDLLAGLGFFSVAVGFAFQDILENTLAGVLLLFRQPFRSGDEIEVQGLIGTVAAITIRETRLRTFDGQLLIVPNRDVYKSAIRVQTAFEQRRLQVDVVVAFESDLGAARTALVAAARSVEGVAADPAPVATVAGFGASGIELRLWAWTDAHQLPSLLVTDEVLTAAKRHLDAAGVELPADIVALQATSSFAAALRGERVTPGGSVAPNTAHEGDGTLDR